jgi:anti-sigma regulatory factor (Ser/Thr protein kinase)
MNTIAPLCPGPLAVAQTTDHTPHQARTYVRAALLGQTDATVGQAELIVSELATNVARYAPGRCSIEAGLTDDGRIRITVMDQSAEPIRITPPGPAATESGLGLYLLLALGAELTVSATADGGKSIAATFAPIGVIA